MGKNAKLKAQRRANMARIVQVRNEEAQARNTSTLADALFSQQAKKGFDGAYEAWRERVILNIDNVVKYASNQDKVNNPHNLEPWDLLLTDAVNVRPPFECMWMEYSYVSDIPNFGTLQAGFDFLYVDDENDENGYIEVNRYSRRISPYGTSDVVCDMDMFPKISREGKILWKPTGFIDAIHNMTVDDPDDALEMRNGLVLPLLAIAFMNCRNIETVEHIPSDHQSKAHRQHCGTPSLKFKTLHIKGGNKYQGAGEPKDHQDLMPLHLRRGNFATYTDSAPLFGKFTGTFWRPATTVGSEKNGIVVKDYEVEASNG